MSPSMRCRLTGCDLDDCGVCRRCGDESKANHAWADTDRGSPCYRKEACERCGTEREQPDHDWEMSESPGPDGIAMKCSRCGLKI